MKLDGIQTYQAIDSQGLIPQKTPAQRQDEKIQKIEPGYKKTAKQQMDEELKESIKRAPSNLNGGRAGRGNFDTQV